MGREVALEVFGGGAGRGGGHQRGEAHETVGLAAAPDRLSTHVVDIADRAAVEALPPAVIARFGAVDGSSTAPGSSSRSNGSRTWTTRRSNAFRRELAGHGVPDRRFCRSCSSGRRDTSSTSRHGRFPAGPRSDDYGASKAAVKLFTEGLNSECLARTSA